MIKYSFIVPVYNTEKYLEKCLDSLVHQTYKNFEIIIINDGSFDNSKEIINKYMKKNTNIVLIEQQNQGLSVARNHGVKKARGEYFIFVDSDDYVEVDLLETIDCYIENVSILRYQVICEDRIHGCSLPYKECGFDVVSGRDAFQFISAYHYVEVACCYVFNREYFVKHHFQFKENVYHEDYGLIPYVIFMAPSVKSISYLGYHYVQRNGSIMNNADYSKTVKKVYDMLYQYIDIKMIIKKNRVNKDNYLLSYLANCVIIKARELKRVDRKKYIEKLKKEKIYHDILADTVFRKLKKFIMLISFELYLRVVK